MANESVGQVSLDLLLNSKEFETKLTSAINSANNNINNKMNKSLGNTGALLGKLGKLAAGAFAVGSIVNFGKEAISLGSDLEEVANVVNSTYTTMASTVDKMAQDSITRLGMSETSYKKMMGTMGAMSKSFGFSEEQALNMADSITALTADVASFYNLSHDEAYTKMKSIFTGETESLKDLGVVMTQAALDEFALANGFGKTTKAMNEQEKVALRYKFVMNQLSTASGDFQRTSDGFANQSKILAEQWKAFQTSIGQGLLNFATPIIKVLNTLMAKLVTLGNLFNSFTSKIFGKAEVATTSMASSMDSNMSGLADAASVASESVEGVGESMAEAAKASKKQTFGFDELTTLQDPNESSSSGGGAGASGGMDFDGMLGGLTETTAMQDALNEETTIYEKILDNLVKKAKELVDLFTKGFKIGLDTTNITTAIESIKTSIGSIKTSLMNIFGDKEVLGAADNLLNTLSFTFGNMIGTATGVATSIGNALISGIAEYLSSNEGFLKEKFTNILNGLSESTQIIGQAFSDVGQIIADTFNSEEASTLVSDFIALLVNPFLDFKDKALTIFNDIAGGVGEFISRYKETFTEGFKNTFSIVSDILNGAKTIIMDVIQIAYDSYEKYIKPTLQNLGNKVNELMDKYVIPLGNTFVECWNKIADNLAIIWENWLKPFVKWFIEGLVRDIMSALDNIIEIGSIFVGRIIQFVEGMIRIISGIIDFIVGIFTGDWEKCWQGVKDIFWGFVKQIESVIGFFVDLAMSLFGDFFKKISDTWNNTWKAIGDFFYNIFNSIGTWLLDLFDGIVSFGEKAKNFIDEKIKAIQKIIYNLIVTAVNEFIQFKTNVSDAFQKVYDTASTVFNNIKSLVSNIFSSLVSIVKAPINTIIGLINDKLIGSLNNLSIDVPDWLQEITGMETFGFNLSKIPQLANGGVVSAPTLSVIGEGPEPEVVSPISTLRAIENEGNAETNELLRQLISINLQILNKDQNLNIDGYQFASLLTNIQDKESRRRG